jgi:hypothetical protein
MSRTTFRGLIAVRIAAGSPQDAGEEHGNNNGHDDEWGSDVHAKISLPLDYQTTPAINSARVAAPRATPPGFIMDSLAFPDASRVSIRAFRPRSHP